MLELGSFSLSQAETSILVPDACTLARAYMYQLLS